MPYDSLFGVASARESGRFATANLEALMSVRIIVSALALSITFAACGSSGPSENPCGLSTNLPSGDACGSCQTKSCKSELAAAFGAGYESGNFSGGACEALLECASECGCADSACLSGCGVPSAECQDALAKLATCQGANCSTDCSSVSSSSSSSGGTTTTAPGTVTVACYNATEHGCAEAVVPDYAVDPIQKKCTDEGQAASSKCPSAGLIGCCDLFGATACYYQGTDEADAQMGCGLAGGMWSTTH